MASYTTDQPVFVIKTIYSPGGSRAAVVRHYRQEFSVHVVQSSDTIYQIGEQFKKTVSVYDKCVNRCKHIVSVHTDEDICIAWEAITRSARKTM
jgi:hypothetical protein